MSIKNIAKHIRDRRSVRTFDERTLDSHDLEALSTLMKSIENPYGIPVEFKLLNAKEHGLTCPVVVGTDVYVGGKSNTVRRRALRLATRLKCLYCMRSRWG